MTAPENDPYATVDPLPAPPGDKGATLPPASDDPHATRVQANSSQAASVAAAVGPPVPGYEIVRELGRGGMGVVYLARQVSLKRPVALKMVLAGLAAGEAARTRFRAEAESVARLRHPGVVQVYEVGEADGHPYFSMEYIEGGSLAAKLDGTLWPPRPAAQLVQALANAVEHAHRQGIIHRDLKPANVLLDGDGTPRVTDFGLAKQLGGDSSPTLTGEVFGTPSYMAPEQAAGQGKTVGPTTDVYALGAILYQLLTGRPPFRAETPMDTMAQVVHEEPTPVRRLNLKVPRDLETICSKCLAKSPEKRYPSAALLVEDLRRFLAGEPITARPVRRVERGWRWLRRRPALVGALGTLSLMLILATLILGLTSLLRGRWGESTAHLGEKAGEREGKPSPNLEQSTIGGDGLAAVKSPDARDKARPAESDVRQWQDRADLLDGFVKQYKDLAGEDRQAEYARLILDIASQTEATRNVTKQSNPDLRRAAARVAAARGRVLNENLPDFLEFPKGNPAQALAAYERAIELSDPAPAEYFVGRGFARFMLIFLSGKSSDVKKDWPKVEADAREAKKRDPNYYETFQLLAIIRHFEDLPLLGIPTNLRTPGTPLTKGREAADYYQQAIDKCQGDPAKERFKPTLLYNRSQFLIGFVSQQISDKAEKAKYLQEAVADAAEAIRSGFPNVQKAYDAKGCALEDLGWLAGDATQFDRAVKELQQAVDVTRRKGYKDAPKDVAKYRLDLGRCQFRAAEFGHRGEKLYKEAAENLDAVARGQASGAVRDEANYWLGRSKWALGESEAAEAAFQAVKTGKSRLLKQLALADSAGLLIEQAEWALRTRQSPADYLTKLQVVVNDLDLLNADSALKGVPKLTADLLRGRIAEYEKKAAAADAAYRKVLEDCKARNLTNEPVYVQAAAAWLRLRLDERWQQDIKRLKPDDLAAWAKVIKDYLDAYPWVLGAKASAAAYAAAAQAFEAAGSDEKADAKLRKAARDCLERAATLTPVGDLDGVRLRLRLAEQTAKLLADHPAYGAPALKFLKEVEDAASSEKDENKAKELAKRLAAK